MKQPTLFPRPQGAPPLTDRQAFALAEVEHTPDGLPAHEVGARLHARRGKHHAGTRCEWCPEEGTSVLRALRRKGLVVRRRSGLWQSLRVKPSTIGPGDLPEGF